LYPAKVIGTVTPGATTRRTPEITPGINDKLEGSRGFTK